MIYLLQISQNFYDGFAYAVSGSVYCAGFNLERMSATGFSLKKIIGYLFVSLKDYSDFGFNMLLKI